MTSGIRGAHLHFDCAAGIAGDMTVAALVDLGVPESVVLEALAKLPVSGYRASFSRVKRGALVGLKFRVEIDAPPTVDQHDHAHDDHAHHEHAHDEHAHDEHAHHAHAHHAHDDHDHAHDDHDHAHDDHEHAHADHGRASHHGEHGHSGGGDDHHHAHHAHRHYAEIRAMLIAAPLGDGTRRRALDIFDRIARVEAKLHGTTVEEVAFHEVGAIDSIVDIVGAAAALDWLSPSRVTSRAVALGHGSVRTAHGLLPIPAPATLELLLGALVEDGGVPFELTTPTGAAIIAATVEEFGALPSMQVAGVGWGAGDRELADRPNLLRVIAGTPDAAAGDRCFVLEANVDDATPELLGPLIAELLSAGARDAWIAPVLMKKGRPAHLISALVDAARRGEVETALLRGSTTIGVRRHEVTRTVLARRMVEVETPFGAVPVKVADGPGGDENVAPEMDACLRLAKQHGVPQKRVYAEALAAYYRR